MHQKVSMNSLLKDVYNLLIIFMIKMTKRKDYLMILHQLVKGQGFYTMVSFLILKVSRPIQTIIVDLERKKKLFISVFLYFDNFIFSCYDYY